MAEPKHHIRLSRLQRKSYTSRTSSAASWTNRGDEPPPSSSHSDLFVPPVAFSCLPPRSPTATAAVQLAAIISGHGGCEFVPTSHHFVVNGVDFNTSTIAFDRFMLAGSKFGCTRQVPQGAMPNEHGTWYYGRNGWCDGRVSLHTFSPSQTGVATSNTLPLQHSWSGRMLQRTGAVQCHCRTQFRCGGGDALTVKCRRNRAVSHLASSTFAVARCGLDGRRTFHRWCGTSPRPLFAM